MNTSQDFTQLALKIRQHLDYAQLLLPGTSHCIALHCIGSFQFLICQYFSFSVLCTFFPSESLLIERISSLFEYLMVGQVGGERLNKKQSASLQTFCLLSPQTPPLPIVASRYKYIKTEVLGPSGP